MPLKPNYKETERLRKKIPKSGFYYSVDLVLSPAYLDLNESSIRLFYHFALASKFYKVKGENHYWKNGSIGLPESEFRNIYNYSSQTYYNARDQLIRNGFIKQTVQGGFGPGYYAKYKLLFLSDVPKRHQRWRYFPDKTYEKDIPKRKNATIGEKTRFKKGVANRTVKSTLTE
tara:strand:- start:312 stop:830 length:519 start_codon:yes stop_codon:yes gene_type:complete